MRSSAPGGGVRVRRKSEDHRLLVPRVHSGWHEQVQDVGGCGDVLRYGETNELILRRGESAEVLRRCVWAAGSIEVILGPVKPSLLHADNLVRQRVL